MRWQRLMYCFLLPLHCHRTPLLDQVLEEDPSSDVPRWSADLQHCFAFARVVIEGRHSRQMGQSFLDAAWVPRRVWQCRNLLLRPGFWKMLDVARRASVEEDQAVQETERPAVDQCSVFSIAILPDLGWVEDRQKGKTRQASYLRWGDSGRLVKSCLRFCPRATEGSTATASRAFEVDCQKRRSVSKAEDLPRDLHSRKDHQDSGSTEAEGPCYKARLGKNGLRSRKMLDLQDD